MAKTPRLHEMSTLRRVLLGALIGVVVGALLAFLRSTDLFEAIEVRFIDVRTEHFIGDRPPDPRIVMCEIHDDDVRIIQKAWALPWPWPLEINAEAFKLMAAAGVQTLVVDMFHLDKGATLEDVRLAQRADLATVDRSRYEYEAEQGALLKKALLEVRSVALAFDLDDQADYEVPVRVEAAEGRLLEGTFVGSPPGLVRQGANLPVHLVTEGAKVLGFAAVPQGIDGITRGSWAVGRWRERPVPSLALAAAALITNGDIEFKDGGVRVGEAFQRLMPNGAFLTNFRGDPGTPYPRVAPSTVLGWSVEYGDKGEVPEAARKALEGKVVIWGLNLAGQEDKVATPLRGKFHGPEYQATALDNLLHGDGRVRAPWAVDLAVLFALTIGLGAAAGAMRSRYLPHLVPLLSTVVLLVVCFVVFSRGVSLDLFTPLMGIVLLWVVTSVVRLLTEGRRNRWLEGTFGRYLAPSIIQALKDDPDLVALGGRRRKITILFSDVAGFTRISEKLEAEDVVMLLNRYLTAHSAAVMEEGGVVDKFEGDAVMAFFGDPVPNEHHAEQGCRAALSAIERLPALQPIWEELGLTEFKIRVGVNTGEAIVGNMGSAQRFDYTCMGDSVNLASRLEGANKAFNSIIMIGSRTYADAKDTIVAKPLAGVIVVGRSRPEPVYELLGLKASASAETVAHAEAFARAEAAAKAGDLAAAREALAEADRLRPDDGPVRWLSGLLDRMEAGEVESPWSGVIELTGK